MSENTQNTEKLLAEISRFDFTEEEKASIFSYFIDQPDKISITLTGLSRFKDEGKVSLFKKCLTSATTTETDKGISVRKHGTQMTFPLQLTATTRRIVEGKFKSPPNAKDVIEDSHSTPLLATRKPDFVFVPRGCPLNALNVAAVGEIRKRSGNDFINADVGHAVSFGEKVLQLQPRRAYVYVVLTDCRVISIFKVIRFSCEYTAPPHKLTYESRDSPPSGWRYLVTIMECSPDEPSLNFGLDTVTLVRPINTGRTSVGKKCTESSFEFEITSSSDPPPGR
ncbi:6693_t:CDS:2, partial [Ambispora gerdemannii]